MDGPAGLRRTVAGERACGGCGWAGPMEHLRGAGPGGGLGSGDGHDAGGPGRGDGLGDVPGPGDPLAVVCPRCGCALPPDPPSVGEILAARRAPDA